MRFPFYFYKAGPSDFVVKYVNGRKVAYGVGKIFFVGPRTNIIRISMADQPVAFAFTEITQDGQDVFVQGELHVRYITDVLLARKDFSVDPRTGFYTCEDPETISGEISHALQTFVRREIQKRTLKEAIATVTTLHTSVMAAIKEEDVSFKSLGVSVVNLFVTAISPANHDLRRALEATIRERILSEADGAVAERRKFAAEHDREIKQYEAETQRLLEQDRTELIRVRNENNISEATADAIAIEKRLEPYKDIDPSMLFALGFRDMGASGRVGQFNVTPEFLAAFNRVPRNDSSGGS